MSGRAYLCAGWLRAWHWTNAALFLSLIVTGVSLHFSGADDRLIGFDTARILHNVAGLGLTGLYLFWVVANVRSGNVRHYLYRDAGMVRDLMTMGHHVGIGLITGRAHPLPPTVERKFNVVQQMTYLAVMYLGLPLLIITGLLFFFPEFMPDQILGLAGLWPVAIAHTVLGAALTLFLIGHVYMGTTGVTPLAGFRMMLTGWHDDHSKK